MPTPIGTPAETRSRRLVPGLVALIATVLTSPMAVVAAPQAGDSSSVVRVTVLPARSRVAPGEVVPIAVILDHERRWHTQAGGPDADADSIPTTVSVTSLSSTDTPTIHPRTDAIQWPVAELKPLRWAGPGASVAVYSDRSIIYVPIEIDPGAASGAVEFTVTIGYQACDDRVCLGPVSGQPFTVRLAITPNAAELPFDNAELFAAYRPVAPQQESSARSAGGTERTPIWIHAVCAGTIAAAVIVALAAGMLSPQGVLLLRLVSIAVALGAGVVWLLMIVL